MLVSTSEIEWLPLRKELLFPQAMKSGKLGMFNIHKHAE